MEENFKDLSKEHHIQLEKMAKALVSIIPLLYLYIFSAQKMFESMVYKNNLIMLAPSW